MTAYGTMRQLKNTVLLSIRLASSCNLKLKLENIFWKIRKAIYPKIVPSVFRIKSSISVPLDKNNWEVSMSKETKNPNNVSFPSFLKLGHKYGTKKPIGINIIIFPKILMMACKLIPPFNRSAIPANGIRESSSILISV